MSDLERPEKKSVFTHSSGFSISPLRGDRYIAPDDHALVSGWFKPLFFVIVYLILFIMKTLMPELRVSACFQ